ncbi:MAG TPA: hypothetical protein VKB80_22960 [Kofleriaceae bacterium]|nr:hypothetical protein [Kofleriaceae bacterium]
MPRPVAERMLGFANHLGLYAEETGARGEALGLPLRPGAGD